MKKLFIAICIMFSGLVAGAQEKKDSVIVTDSTEIISIKHLNDLMEFFKGTLTVNEYNKIMPAIQQLAAIAEQEYRQKKKKVKILK